MTRSTLALPRVVARAVAAGRGRDERPPELEVAAGQPVRLEELRAVLGPGELRVLEVLAARYAEMRPPDGSVEVELGELWDAQRAVGLDGPLVDPLTALRRLSRVQLTVRGSRGRVSGSLVPTYRCPVEGLGPALVRLSRSLTGSLDAGTWVIP